MLLLRDLDYHNLQAWHDRLATMEAADEFDGRDYYIQQAKDVIEAHRYHGRVLTTPEKRPTEGAEAVLAPDAP